MIEKRNHPEQRVSILQELAIPSRKVAIPEPLSRQATHHGFHLVNRVHRALIVPTGKLVHLFGSSGFRVGETDRGAPLGEAAVTVQAHAVTCRARDGGGDGRATQKSEVPRIGAAAQRMRDDVVDLDQMR